MFKLGRGSAAGRGNGKRALPPQPSTSLHRPAAAASSGRGRIGATSTAGRGRPSGPPTLASAPVREETFSLAPGIGPLDFGAIIRLTPDLVDEIRRLEAEGGVSRIKFDSNMNNTSGNVIDVGGKEFSFTWSRELGDCDIYEENRNGESGDGLLVERGSAWRKITVQRILDESTKNHVKMRSEEAERLSKSRKAIVLDPANPSVKNQAKSMAAAGVEGSMRRMGWKHKEFSKTRKVDSNQVPSIGSSRPVFKSVTASNNTKRKCSVSPLSSPPEQHVPGTSVSSFGIGTKGDSHNDESTGPSIPNKEVIDSLEKESPKRVPSDIKFDPNWHPVQISDQTLNLRRFLITTLSKNPKGMHLKALEKAVGETFPNSDKKIESILKNIATFEAPGRYFLKPGAELDSSNLLVPEIRSSPHSSHGHTPAIEAINVEKNSNEKIERQQSHSDLNLEEELDVLVNIDTVESSQEPFASAVKVNNDNQGAGSSSESGSDSESESESSDSGSESDSQSRASSSDSESDASSSSKEVSDVDVDIMSSDNEREVIVHKSEYENDHEKDDIRIGQEGQTISPYIDLNAQRMDENLEIIEVVDPSKSSPLNRRNENFEDAEIAENIQISKKNLPISPYQVDQSAKQQMSFDNYSLHDINGQVLKSSNIEKQTTRKNGSQHELSDSSGKVTPQRSKRTNSEYSGGRPEGAKRVKAASSAQILSLRNAEGATKQHVSPDAPAPPKHDRYKSHVMQSDNIFLGQKNTDSDSQESSPPMYGRTSASESIGRIYQSPVLASGLDTDHSGQNTGDHGKKGLESMAKPSISIEKVGNRYAETSRDNLDRNLYRRDNSNLNEKVLNDNRNDNICSSEYLAKSAGEIIGDKRSAFQESCLTKSIEHFSSAKIKGQQFGKQKYAAEKSLTLGSKGPMLRRELSDLELGEFRETPKDSEECGEIKRQQGRKGSAKTLENKATANDGADIEKSKGRTVTNPDLGTSNVRPGMNASSCLRKKSPHILRVTEQGNHALHRKEPDESILDSAQSGKLQQRAMVSQNELPRSHHVDSEVAYWDKSTESTERNEKRPGQRIVQEKHSGAYKKVHDNTLPQLSNLNGGHTVQSNGVLAQKSNVSERSKSNFLRVNDSNDRNIRESSDDDENSFYLKYDKDEPELKGPIKDFSQYTQYMQEFLEKHKAYCYLYENCEKIRTGFLELGNDLEIAKRGDTREYIAVIEKMKNKYRNCRERNEQMKKVFLLLHSELQNLKERLFGFAKAHTSP